MPVWLAWLQYVSFIKYSFSAMVLLCFEGSAEESNVNALYGTTSVGVSIIVSVWPMKDDLNTLSFHCISGTLTRDGF